MGFFPAGMAVQVLVVYSKYAAHDTRVPASFARAFWQHLARI